MLPEGPAASPANPGTAPKEEAAAGGSARLEPRGYRNRKGAVRDTAAAMALALLAACSPPGDDDSAKGRQGPSAAAGLPWQVERLPHGGTRALGLEPGRSRLQEAALLFGPDYELALFEDSGASLSLEAYYHRVVTSGLTAKLILTLEAEAGELEAYRADSPRRRPQEGGGARYALSKEAFRAAPSRVISGLSYIPSANLEPETLRARFGPPAIRLEEGDSLVHWLYPELGVDILIDANGRELIQYVHPSAFERLRAPIASGQGPRIAPETGAAGPSSSADANPRAGGTP